MKQLAVSVLTIAILTSACGGGSTLTDAQVLWCNEEWSEVDEVAEASGLMTRFEVWYANRGVTFDDDGNPTSIDKFNEVAESQPDFASEGEAGPFYEAVDAEYLEHADGVSACTAAYDSR
ncbi:MAG: hypothetical protein ACR2N7_02520 [Acidimicrobiia bacterium]